MYISFNSKTVVSLVKFSFITGVQLKLDTFIGPMLVCIYVFIWEGIFPLQCQQRIVYFLNSSLLISKTTFCLNLVSFSFDTTFFKDHMRTHTFQLLKSFREPTSRHMEHIQVLRIQRSSSSHKPAYTQSFISWLQGYCTQTIPGFFWNPFSNSLFLFLYFTLLYICLKLTFHCFRIFYSFSCSTFSFHLLLVVPI